MEINPALPLSILTASFLGSWHCAGMCGPIAGHFRSKNSLVSYQLGRFFSYSFLGLIAGSIGEALLASLNPQIRIVSNFVLGILLVLTGLSYIFSNRLSKGELSKFFSKYFPQYNSNNSGFIIGLLTIFLPCGWLYTFVAAAITTKSAIGGTILMQLFWLGSLPSLSAIPFILRKGFNSGQKKLKYYSATILMIAGIYTIIGFWI